MRYNLAQLARQQRNTRRQSIALREIVMPGVLATDLYRSVYKPVIDTWTAALPRIEAVYARTLAEMVTDSPADVRAEIDGASAAVQRLLLILTPNIRDWALRVERSQRQKWAGAVLSATDVAIDSLMGPEDVRGTLESFIERNVALVRDVSAQAQARISDAVFRGLSERRPARNVAKDLRDAVSLSRKRSLNVASDQLSKISGSLAEERQRQAGIEQVIWRSSRKLHPRKHHAARDGKRYYLETKRAVDGSETVAPGDWVSQPPFCGCRTQAWIDLMGD
ncbi:putative phage-related protein [Sphingobium sp. SYK-6]|uniref:phage minor head protein n=1 Tax=Sphingobium sp. (strain NBRC 103272 / SYK-6) TaxID=627192 RepID=UPI000227712A|nr:phage minor head protein [Sphingobium sp. SYK-6]BAK66878.1 putative phage-related protein [Sphingobium sp. SYK-6]